MCSQITVIAGIPVYTRSLYVSVLDEEVAMMLTWRTALAVAPYAGVCVWQTHHTSLAPTLTIPSATYTLINVWRII